MLHDIVLGVVQGLTEFLPVSSSGHLVVVPAVLGWEQPSVTFDLLLHLATLIAVVVALRHELVALAGGMLGRGTDPASARRMVLYLAIGTVPATVAGLALASTFEQVFDRPLWVCAFWVVTGVVLLVAERLMMRVATRPGVDGRSSLVIGTAQAAAITPGISRSGMTIAAGMSLGLSRAEAARYSFLLSIPIILGATAGQVPDVVGGRFEMTASVWAGMLAAGVSGYLAVTGLLRYLRTSSLRIFALYLFVVAPLAALIITIR